MATQMTDACASGHHETCSGAVLGASGYRDCLCECHEESKPVPPADEHGYWTWRPTGGLRYHAYDPATEDDNPGWA